VRWRHSLASQPHRARAGFARNWGMGRFVTVGWLQKVPLRSLMARCRLEVLGLAEDGLL
jgi:hypothetical protein